MNAPFRLEPSIADAAWNLRQNIAEHLHWMQMHAEHAADYAAAGNDTLAKASLRRVGIYYEAAHASMKELSELRGRAHARQG